MFCAYITFSHFLNICFCYVMRVLFRTKLNGICHFWLQIVIILRPEYFLFINRLNKCWFRFCSFYCTLKQSWPSLAVKKLKDRRPCLIFPSLLCFWYLLKYCAGACYFNRSFYTVTFAKVSYSKAKTQLTE